jgi:hypothetical protein
MGEKLDWLVPSVAESYMLETDLVDELLRREDRTEHIFIDDPKDISLSDEGKTLAGGYRFSEKAFSMICRQLLRGLYPMCLGLCGITQRVSDPPEIFSWREMVLLYNTVVRRRYALLTGARLVVDLDSKVICGVLGRSTKVLTNFRVWEILKDTLEEERFPIAFREAQLLSRKMVLYLVDEQPAFSIPIDGRDEMFGTGFRLVNSDGGDAAVRGSAVLVREFNGSYIGDRLPMRTKHAGKDFRQKLNRMMRVVTERKEVLKTYKRFLEEAGASALTIPAPGDARKAFVGRLTNRLVRTHVRRSLANKIVSTLLSRAMHLSAEDRFLIPPSMRQLSQASVLDLVFAAAWVAGQPDVSAGDREYAEHWALYAAKNPDIFTES